MEVRQCNLAFLFLVNLYLNCLSLGRYFQVFVSAKCSSAFYIFAGHAGVCPTTKRPPFCIKPKIIYNCQVDTDCQGHEKCCLDPCDKSCVPRKLCKYFMYRTLANISKVIHLMEHVMFHIYLYLLCLKFTKNNFAKASYKMLDTVSAFV